MRREEDSLYVEFLRAQCFPLCILLTLSLGLLGLMDVQTIALNVIVHYIVWYMLCCRHVLFAQTNLLQTAYLLCLPDLAFYLAKGQMLQHNHVAIAYYFGAVGSVLLLLLLSCFQRFARLSFVVEASVYLLSVLLLIMYALASFINVAPSHLGIQILVHLTLLMVLSFSWFGRYQPDRSLFVYNWMQFRMSRVSLYLAGGISMLYYWADVVSALSAVDWRFTQSEAMLDLYSLWLIVPALSGLSVAHSCVFSWMGKRRGSFIYEFVLVLLYGVFFLHLGDIYFVWLGLLDKIYDYRKRFQFKIAAQH